MPKVNVSGSSSKPAEEVFKAVRNMLDQDQQLQQLDPGFSTQYDKANLSGKIAGKQFKADLQVTTQGAQSQVSIIVDLPFHLGLIKGVVQKTLQSKLDDVLA